MSENRVATLGWYPVLLAVFTATLVISNITAGKPVEFFSGLSVSFGFVQIFPLILDGAFFLFPLAYILGDVISEVYGLAAARRAILVGFVVSLLAAGSFTLAIHLPIPEWYDGQQAFASVLGQTPRLLAAGLLAYLVGQFLNAVVLVWIKDRFGSRRLWIRLIGSTVVAELADTLIFCSIAAGVIGITTASQFINYVAVGFVWKTLAEVLVLPITYRVVAALKRVEPAA